MVAYAIKLVRPYFHAWDAARAVHKLFLLFLALGALLLILVLRSRTAADFFGDPLVFFYALFVTTFELSRLGAALLFPYAASRAISPVASAHGYEPFVTFVIPCKNEERAIAHTVEQCFAADYPSHKLEVIAVNDGSTDGTGDALRDLRAVYPELVVIDWQINRGKKHALAEGFRRARGEILIPLDSDSFIQPDTFRNLIGPFVDPAIGAICAPAEPANAGKNSLTRMQAAYYFLSFRILKAAESVFAAVFCCSGCSSAYRKSAIFPLVDEWLHETFLGLPVTWGDDRSLTNRVLKAGFQTMYTDRVQAYTIVPDTLRTFLKQQIRWKKSWFVSSVFAVRFIARRRPFVAFTYFFPLVALTLVTPFLAAKALLINPIFFGISPLPYITGILLMTSLVTLYYRHLSRSDEYWPYVFLWAAINAVFLSYILVYSLATIQNRRWGTR